MYSKDALKFCDRNKAWPKIFKDYSEGMQWDV